MVCGGLRCLFFFGNLKLAINSFIMSNTADRAEDRVEDRAEDRVEDRAEDRVEYADVCVHAHNLLMKYYNDRRQQLDEDIKLLRMEEDVLSLDMGQYLSELTAATSVMDVDIDNPRTYMNLLGEISMKKLGNVVLDLLDSVMASYTIDNPRTTKKLGNVALDLINSFMLLQGTQGLDYLDRMSVNLGRIRKSWAVED